MLHHIILYLSPLLQSFAFSGKWFLICAVIFMPLAWLFPSKKQPMLRRDMMADGLYWFCAPIVYSKVGQMMTVFLALSLYSRSTVYVLSEHGLSPVADLPILLQAALALLLTDIFQYWTHRLFHWGGFWKFHAIHHSPKTIDWLSAARFHPINILIHSLGVGAIVFVVGFSPEAYAILLPFNMLYSPLVHANLNWTYGPFKYVLASPVFHRWHHTFVAEGGSKNFAPTFPFLDVIFGTFHMPKGIQPSVFGTEHDAVPDDLFGQLAYPFKKKEADNNVIPNEAEGSPL